VLTPEVTIRPHASGLGCLVVGASPGTAELVRLLRANSNVGAVVVAPNAATALRVLHGAQVDLAFIELRMPGIDGADLAGVLNRFRAVPAIVFTAYGPEGPCVFLAKSQDLRSVERVGKYLDMSSLEKQPDTVFASFLRHRHPWGRTRGQNRNQHRNHARPWRGDVRWR